MNDLRVQKFLTSVSREEETQNLAPTHRHSLFQLAIQDTPHTSQLVTAQETNTAIQEKLLEYRLVDIVHYMNGRPERDHVYGMEDLPDITALPISKLNNIQTLFRETSQEFKTFLATCDTSEVFAPSSNTTRSLFNSLGITNVSQKVLKILKNIQSAGFCLSYALDEGNFHLPNTTKDLFDYFSSSAVPTETEAQIWNAMDSTTLGSELLGPLQIAMLVSPIALLIPRNFKTIPSRGKLDQVWRGVRSWPKPPEAVAAERIMWKTVFNVARGVPVRESITQAFKSIAMIDLSRAVGWLTNRPQVVKTTTAASRPQILGSGQQSSQVQVQSTDRPIGVYPVNDQQSNGSPRGDEPATPVEKGGSNVRDDTSGDRSGDQRPEEDVSRAKDAALAANTPLQPIINNPVDGQRDVGDEEQAQPGAGGIDQGGKGQDKGDEADAQEDEEGSQVAKTVGDPCAEEGQGGDKGSAGSCLEREERRREHEEQGPADKATGEGDKRGADVGDKGSASRTSGYNSEGGDQPDRSEDEPEIGNDKREPDGEQGKGESDTQGSGGGEGTATPRTPENSNLPDASPATPADGGRGADK
ncbi:hypothetical protein DXG01_009246, partial [Tephrocybe rancida]